MKKSKWVWWTLTILLTLVVLVGVGAAGFRMGLVQSANFNGKLPAFGHMPGFAVDFNNQSRDPHMQIRGFDQGRGFDRGGWRGGFSLLFGFFHAAVLALLIWAGYRLYRRSGWQFVKVNSAVQSNPEIIDEKKE